MNNCIIQGRVVNIGKVKFYYYNLKAVLNVCVSISYNNYNIMECRIYDENIDIFLDKYTLNDNCILSGSLRKKDKKDIYRNDYLKVIEMF